MHLISGFCRLRGLPQIQSQGVLYRKTLINENKKKEFTVSWLLFYRAPRVLCIRCPREHLCVPTVVKSNAKLVCEDVMNRPCKFSGHLYCLRHLWHKVKKQESWGIDWWPPNVTANTGVGVDSMSWISLIYCLYCPRTFPSLIFYY